MAKQRVVILGAGPAGMSAAWRLSQLGHHVTVLERDGAVGGMGKTIRLGDYAVDYGPHTFHIRETDESRAVIQSIRPFFGADPLILTRGTRVFLQGKYYIYPLELLQVLFGVKPSLSARIFLDYILATAKTMFSPPKAEDSFEEWGVRNLGRTLYDLCFGIYSERVWGLPTSQISSKQAQRVAKLNLKNIILRTLGIKADPAAHFTEYMYPRAGISDLYENMAARFRACGGQLLLDSPATRLERDGNRICAVSYRRNGREAMVPCRGVVSTLPLPALVRMISPALPAEVLDHAARLRYRSLKLVYVVLTREQLTDFHWVYLLDKTSGSTGSPSRRTSARTWCRKAVRCSASRCPAGRTSRSGRRPTRSSSRSRFAICRRPASAWIDRRWPSITSSGSRPPIRCTS